MRAWRALGVALALLAGCEQAPPPAAAPRPAAVRAPVLLGHQQPLTEEQFKRALAAWAQGRQSFQERAAYLKAKDLDPALYMPDLGWNDVVTNPFREFLLAEPSRARVEQLRMHTQSFTGHSLYLFGSPRDVPPPPQVVPAKEWDAQHVERLHDGSVRFFEALRRELPAKYVVKVPRMMGEVGWDVDGHVVNWDVAAYQESVAVLERAGVLAWLEKRIAAGETISVLEIGSGYGGFAYFFTEILPGTGYWLCDLPESLPVAAMYLSATRGAAWKGIHPDCAGGCAGPGLIGLANHRFEEFAAQGRKVDLAINMLSLSEMPERQIDYYGRKVSALLGKDGVFFEQNYDNRSLGFTNAKDILPRHLSASTDLGESVKRGHGHLWANDPAVLERVKAARP